MRNLHAELANITAKRRATRARARRIASVCAFLSDGMALLCTLVLIGALVALVPTAFDDTTYALVVTDAGQQWVVDYDLSYDDCATLRSDYALGVAMCDPAKG